MVTCTHSMMQDSKSPDDTKIFLLKPHVFFIEIPRYKIIICAAPGTDPSSLFEIRISGNEVWTWGDLFNTRLTRSMAPELGTTEAAEPDAQVLSAPIDYLNGRILVDGKVVYPSLLDLLTTYTKTISVSDYLGWQLFFTGHSMGATIMPLIALRVAPFFPNVNKAMLLLSPWLAYSTRSVELMEKQLGFPIVNIINRMDPIPNYFAFTQALRDYFFTRGGSTARMRPFGVCLIIMVSFLLFYTHVGMAINDQWLIS